MEAGFDYFAVADHVWQHPIMGCSEENEPECYTMLSFFALHTERVKLGRWCREYISSTRRHAAETAGANS